MTSSLRTCRNCGKEFKPVGAQRFERKNNSYCTNDACQTEKYEERHRRQIKSQRKFKVEHPDYEKKSHRSSDTLYRDDKLCSCGNKIEIDTEWPYSLEAPHLPYYCRECRDRQKYMRDHHNCVGDNKFQINFETREGE